MATTRWLTKWKTAPTSSSRPNRWAKAIQVTFILGFSVFEHGYPVVHRMVSCTAHRYFRPKNTTSRTLFRTFRGAPGGFGFLEVIESIFLCNYAKWTLCFLVQHPEIWDHVGQAWFWFFFLHITNRFTKHVGAILGYFSKKNRAFSFFIPTSVFGVVCLFWFLMLATTGAIFWGYWVCMLRSRVQGLL